jgi:ribonuclease Z
VIFLHHKCFIFAFHKKLQTLLKLTILGCYAATPRSLTNPTSQVLEIANHLFLIDCGEGTQVQLRKNKIKFSKINHIFISHLHGDHCFGLIGLVSTFMLLGRKTDLHIHGPKGIKELILNQLKLTQAYTSYQLYFNELIENETVTVFEDNKVIVRTIPLKHRIYTNGFLFEEKIGERKLNMDAVLNNEIETCYYQKIKNGSDVQNVQGQLIANHILTFDPNLPKSYAFCSDTQFTESILPLVNDVNLLYHESTFLEIDHQKATNTMHSTAKQAATIALKANAKQLCLGHYSTRYKNIEDFKTEAETIFKNVILAEDAKIIKII